MGSIEEAEVSKDLIPCEEVEEEFHFQMEVMKEVTLKVTREYHAMNMELLTL